jgi:hypothetical protein
MIQALNKTEKPKIAFKNLKKVQLSHSQRMKHYWNNISDECKALIKHDKKETWRNKTPEELEKRIQEIRECTLEQAAKRTVRDRKRKNFKASQTWKKKQERRRNGTLPYGEHELYLYFRYIGTFTKYYKRKRKNKRLIHPVRKRIIPMESKHTELRELSGVVHYGNRDCD